MAKRRANGEGSLRFDEKTKKWIATITVDKKRKAFYGKTRQEAINKRETFKQFGGKTIKSLSLYDAIKKVINFKFNENKIGENTYYTNMCTLKTISAYDIVNKNIDNITILDLKDFFEKLSKKEYSSSTIKKIYSELNYGLDYAVEINLIQNNILRNSPTISKPKTAVKNEKVVALEYTEQKNFIEVLKKNPHEYQEIWLLSMYTGMRIGEIMALKKENINFDKKEIKIDRTITRDRKGKSKIGYIPKNMQSIRYIPITNQVYIILKKLLKNSNNQSELLISNAKGDFIDPKLPYSSLKRYVEKYNIAKKCTLHMLRHTFATRLFENDVPTKVVQHLLGHTSIQTTLDTYTDVLKHHEEKYTDKINHMFNELNEIEELDTNTLVRNELFKIKDIVSNSHFTKKQKELLLSDILTIENWLKLA